MDKVRLQTRVFLLILIAVTIGFFLLLKPFYGAIFWAATLAVLFWPVHQRVLARMPEWRNLAAVITVLICVLVVIIPLSAILTSMVQELLQFYSHLNQERASFQQYFDQIVAVIPASVWHMLDRMGLGNFADIQPKLLEAANQGVRIVSTRALSFGQNTLQFGLAFALMLYLLFFFFRDGADLMVLVREAIPMDGRYLLQLTTKFTAVVKATIKGNLVIAAVQGMLGGVMFWALGIQGPILWGVVMAVLSLLPAVGAGLVWGPVALYLLLTGSIFRGLIMVFVGVCVIGLIDNILRPILVGKETKMPDYLVLLSTFGGLAMFGMTGFVVGPVIAALFMAIWAIFISKKNETESSI